MAGSFDELVSDKQVIAIVCNQWGDSGKGKFSDLFAAKWADVIARGTGGANAGHTVVINGKKRIFHLIPAGIVYDSEGKINILGNGMAIDLATLVGELDALDRENLPYNNLMISEDAHLVMPYHIARDKATDASGAGIGSTGRGIGPCYADKIARRGIMVRDLYGGDRLSKLVARAAGFYPEQQLNIEQIILGLLPLAERIRPFVRDTIEEMRLFHKNEKKILLEGAQGLLLSIEYGTYPYVTSSDCSVYGTAQGVGIPFGAVDLTLGIVKFPYMTRVGNGPFPSELGGKESEEYCKDGYNHTLRHELTAYDIPFTEVDDQIKYDHHHHRIVDLMNSDNDFKRGIGIRLAGEEYGATTGRPRRIGWTDLGLLRYAVGINGPDIILTKPDVLQGADNFWLASTKFTRGSSALRQSTRLDMEFAGFNEDISGVRQFYELPATLQRAMSFIEQQAHARIAIVSVGPEQSQTFVK